MTEQDKAALGQCLLCGEDGHVLRNSHIFPRFFQQHPISPLLMAVEGGELRTAVQGLPSKAMFCQRCETLISKDESEFAATLHHRAQRLNQIAYSEWLPRFVSGVAFRVLLQDWENTYSDYPEADHGDIFDQLRHEFRDYLMNGCFPQHSLYLFSMRGIFDQEIYDLSGRHDYRVFSAGTILHPGGQIRGLAMIAGEWCLWVAVHPRRVRGASDIRLRRRGTIRLDLFGVPDPLAEIFIWKRREALKRILLNEQHRSALSKRWRKKIRKERIRWLPCGHCLGAGAYCDYCDNRGNVAIFPDGNVSAWPDSRAAKIGFLGTDAYDGAIEI